MINLELKGIKTICTQESSCLSLSYYLVTSFYQNRPIYSIQIHSTDTTGLIHVETTPYISYSKSYVNHIIGSCMEYLVTPTDMLSSIDLLMNPLF